ncbi:MAG TPA: hypothetical protein VMW45_00225 [Dehalococcoidia bacterium]|nr:hypothetical protein [Dehalococcoidia bacterium]
MKLAEAIELLELELPEYLSNPETDLMDAIKLLIEAGKRCEAYKKAHIGLHYEPLPGETED